MSRRTLIPLLLLAAACGGPTYDLVIRGGTVYDGTGTAGSVADVAIQGDSIAAVGELGRARGRVEVDATGMAVAPGFINMLSWANESLIYDGKSQADIRQGVTLEVMGEGGSMGPLSDTMKVQERRAQGDITYDIAWTTLGDYLEFLEKKGIAPNVASFVGATTVRVHQIGFADRPPTPEELERMKALVAQAMEEGALGLGSSLIYAPAFYSKTDELVELAKVVGRYHGMYISHMRSEGNRLLEATDELIQIASTAGIPAEIYHLKAGGEANWGKMEALLAKVDSARAAGLAITACMYPYPAGATGLDASMPPWVQEGGYEAWAMRLRDPAIRRKVIQEMRTPSNDWENLLLQAGGADKVLLIGFKADSLKPLTGKTLADVAKLRSTSPEEAAMDLVIADGSRVGAAYFIISEGNIAKQFAKPWVSLCSDAESPAPEGPFLKSNPHPRAYGTFARFLGKYVRDERVMPLEEGIRRLTSLPAGNLKIRRRGTLAPGNFADVVVFRPDSIQDHATFDQPHQYATGMVHVFVNGTQVLKDGEHTGALPGRVVRGPGWTGWPAAADGTER